VLAAQRHPSSHQLKSREKSDSALANAGRKILSSGSQQQPLTSADDKTKERKEKNYIKENLN